MKEKKISKITCRECGGEIRAIGTGGYKKWYHVDSHDASPIFCGNCGKPIAFDPETKTFQHWIPSIEEKCAKAVPRYIKIYDSDDVQKRSIIAVEQFDIGTGRYVTRGITPGETELMPDIQPLLNLIRRSQKKK